MEVVDNIYYKEGTDNILKDYKSEDKEYLLKIASNVTIKSYREIGKKVASSLTGLSCTKRKAVKGINEILKFYYNNIPKGFKRVPGFYEICNEDGVCLRYNRRPIPDNKNKKGYIECDLNYINVINDKKQINTFKHRAIALTWIPNDNNKSQVNHKNGIKIDNRKDNLEWNTLIENIKHAHDNGYYNTEKMKLNGNGEKNSQSKLTIEKVIELRKIISDYSNVMIKELSKTFNVSNDIIKDVLNKTNKLDIPRPTYNKLVVNSRSGKLFMKKVLLCKNSENYIRGFMINKLSNFHLQLSIKYNISTPTVRDIVARRSWNYDNC